MSETPETDALYAQMLAENPGNFIHLEEFLELACRLEKERDEALMDRGNEDIATMTRNHYERILSERDEARAVAGAMADIAFKHLTSLLASTPHSKDAAHDEETQQVIAAIKQWKELKQ